VGLGISTSACGQCHACACVFVCLCMRIHMYVGINICAFFAVSVTCTLQVFWALVHGQVSMSHGCVFTPTYTSANTLAAGYRICVYVYMCVYACVCIWMRMCVYDIVRHVEALLLGFSICAYVCICMRMYMCVHVCAYSACVYVCIYIYVCLCISIHIHLYTRACGCTYTLV